MAMCHGHASQAAAEDGTPASVMPLCEVLPAPEEGVETDAEPSTQRLVGVIAVVSAVLVITACGTTIALVRTQCGRRLLGWSRSGDPPPPSNVLPVTSPGSGPAIALPQAGGDDFIDEAMTAVAMKAAAMELDRALSVFYRVAMPEGATRENIEKVLKHFDGKERQLIDALRQQYGGECAQNPRLKASVTPGAGGEEGMVVLCRGCRGHWEKGRREMPPAVVSGWQAAMEAIVAAAQRIDAAVDARIEALTDAIATDSRAAAGVRLPVSSDTPQRGHGMLLALVSAGGQTQTPKGFDAI